MSNEADTPEETTTLRTYKGEYCRTFTSDRLNITTRVDLITINKPGNYVLDGDIHGNLSIESPNAILDGNGHTIHGWVHVLKYPNGTTAIKNVIVKPPFPLLRSDPCRLCNHNIPSDSADSAVVLCHKVYDHPEESNGSTVEIIDLHVISPIPLDYDVSISNGIIKGEGKEPICLDGTDIYNVDLTKWKATPRTDTEPNRAGLCRYELNESNEHESDENRTECNKTDCDNLCLSAKCCEQHECSIHRCINIRVSGTAYCEFHQ